MLNIGFLSLDIIIILIIFLFLFILSYKTGKKTLTTLILACYPSILIFQFFPYVYFESGMAEAVAFMVIYIFTTIVLYKNVSNKKIHTPIRKILDYGSLTIAYIILMVSLSINHVTSLQSIYNFSGFIPNLIEQINYGVALILPLLVILLTNKNDNE